MNGQWFAFDGKVVTARNPCEVIARVEGEHTNPSSECTVCVRTLLFSAAPELLAACKLALGAFERNDCIDWNDLERAINKAEGRS